jgi:DNA-binding NtrC family response regulator
VVPPLRERREDIPLLIEHFLKGFTRAAGNGNGNGPRPVGGESEGQHAQHVVAREIGADTMATLCAYSWPGNVRQLENVIERLVVTGRREVIQVDDLPIELRIPSIGQRPRRERRRTVVDDLFKKLLEDGESFWTAVYPLYMRREITRGNLRELVGKGLEESRGNYKIVARMFNMDVGDYKRFLNFLRKHDCQVPFKEYRERAR